RRSQLMQLAMFKGLRAVFGALLTAGAITLACSNHARDEDTVPTHELGQSTARGPVNPTVPDDAAGGVIASPQNAPTLSPSATKPVAPAQPTTPAQPAQPGATPVPAHGRDGL